MKRNILGIEIEIQTSNNRPIWNKVNTQSRRKRRITSWELHYLPPLSFITIVAWTSKKEANDCVRVHDTELIKEVERKPLK